MNSKENEIKNSVAIVGMAGRFPGATNIDELWRNLCDGKESITFFDDNELDPTISSDLVGDPNYIRARGVLDNADKFDARFFGMTPRQAEIMDPQQRIFLEAAWEALENAGYDPESYDGSIGVYAGMDNLGYSYYINNVLANKEIVDVVGKFQAYLANEKDYLATRVSYKFDLKGPSLNINTACSTSLVTVCMAFQGLNSHQCDVALAGGVSLMCPQNSGYLYRRGDILSSDGHCRPFDADAKGTVFGGGLGIVVLKRLEDALQDRDNIIAIIKGVGINNDGADKLSFTAPSAEGQAKAIEMALSNANVSPDTISYIETHGTGTVLGDPIEISGLNQVFQSKTSEKGYCAIGSIKGNLGHLNTAAGIVSLIKAALSLKNQILPPSINYEKPNPNIDFQNSPFYVNDKLSKWKADKAPRRAGVSCFGIGGTNAHVILEEAPKIETAEKSRSYQLLPLSAKTSSALKTVSINLSNHLKQHSNLNFADVAYTLKVGRKAFNHRRFIISKDLDDAIDALEDTGSKRVLTSYREPIERDIVFIFSGQGSQYANMGKELYRTEPVFKRQVDRCSKIMKEHLDLDLRNILYPDDKEVEEAERMLQQTHITQPALFVTEYALAKLWMAWGVRPAALVGHSIGEYVAACLSGVISLKDALSLVATRGRLMSELPGGAMLTVFLSEKELTPLLNGKLSIAVINGPSLCVVSGKKKDIADLELKLSDSNIESRRLHTSHAFHSKMMDPVLNEFTEQVEKIIMSPSQIPFVSNVTGKWISSDEAMDPGYWAKHLRKTVRFSDCLQEVLKEPNRILLEVGPGNSFSTLARLHPDKKNNQRVFSTTRHPKDKRSDSAFILNTAGQLWLAGIQINWSAFYNSERRHRIPLPSYPFERKRYWIEPVVEAKGFPGSQARPAIRGNIPQGEPSPALQSDLQVSGEPELTGDFMPPRNEVEQILVDLWQKLLGLEQISIDDDYFELGGDSLLAVRMLADIGKIFNKKLPLAILLNSPTIEELANTISNGDGPADRSSIVPIKSNGSKLPFYCVHGAGGHVLEIYPLGRCFPSEWPFYGIQTQFLDHKPTGEIRIEEIAAHYVQEIRSFQPEGPYLLGGYCFGGIVAYEMAQQLQTQGEEVAALLIIDGHCPDQDNANSLGEPNFLLRFHNYLVRKFGLELSNLSVLGHKEKMSYLLTRANRAIEKLRTRTEMMIDPFLTRLNLRKEYSLPYMVEAILVANTKALDNYTIRPYKGRVIIFRASESLPGIPHDPSLGWAKFIEGKPEIYEIPGRHENIIDEPWVQVLSEKFRAALDFEVKSTPALRN